VIPPDNIPNPRQSALIRMSQAIPLPKRLRDQIAKLLQLDDPPEKIAWGVSLGFLIALSPTVGVQMFIVLILHTLLRANRLAGIITVWISNPFTVVPIYWANYLVGNAVLRNPPITFERFKALFVLNADGVFAKFAEFLELLRPVLGDVAAPMFLGGLILGASLAIPAYPLTVALVRMERRGRDRLARLRVARRLRKQRNEARAHRKTGPGR
jgi:uncharacterized protein (DUF2062 family)